MLERLGGIQRQLYTVSYLDARSGHVEFATSPPTIYDHKRNVDYRLTPQQATIVQLYTLHASLLAMSRSELHNVQCLALGAAVVHDVHRPCLRWSPSAPHTADNFLYTVLPSGAEHQNHLELGAWMVVLCFLVLIEKSLHQHEAKELPSDNLFDMVTLLC